MKYTILAILLFFFLGLTSCLPTKTVTESKTVTSEISDLSGKWNIDDGGDYIIFEDATKKMVMKTACGIITADYTKINQAIIFNHLKQVNSDCEIPQNMIQNLQKTAYFKVKSSNQITFYDEAHLEKLTLKLIK
ncbi:hypothetical protein ACTS91_00845 [Empedobacter falsenii]|uniref:hypothetical protein n=1 Tax=Empedobacter TaxID=59734 RepID=UPI002447B2B4|nr:MULTISPECIES: hypothetical protein [Empedobacter]MDH0675088.1 hypothetical protein [Empedobacter sp. GD03861]MDM1042279.1 hypothetical protein [Empedobacter brevis]MDM1136209.1 hypothetical protein [Empedobacter sp. R750]